MIQQQYVQRFREEFETAANAREVFFHLFVDASNNELKKGVDLSVLDEIVVGSVVPLMKVTSTVD